VSEEEKDKMHPPAHTLDAIAAGDPAGGAAAHLAACAPCSLYVAKLKSEAEAFRAGADPAAFAAKVQARASKAQAPERRAKVVWILGPVLAAAAVLLLWVRVPTGRLPQTFEPGSGASSTSSPRTGDVAHFKGGLSVAAIRERDGVQDRLTGPFDAAPGDRLRVEVAVDHQGPITAGLLASDGGWTLLLAPTLLEVGTHYSDLAARFDDSPTDAILLVGSPADVERARTTRDFANVVAWQVRSGPRK
jgi:hypothetical protein